MSSITIREIGITQLHTDAIVNAANEKLWESGGVCGAIKKAIQACVDFINNHPDYEMKIIFAVLDDGILSMGEETLREMAGAELFEIKR